jgi:hypothetical protein
MDAVLNKLDEIANLELPLKKLEEMLAKNLMERNAIITAFNELGFAIVLQTCAVNAYNRNGYVLDVGYQLVNSPVFLYAPSDIPESAGKQ